MPRPLRLALLAGLLLALLPAASYAQETTPADTAAILVEAAEALRADGETAVADGILRHVVERFPRTPAADVARRLLGEALRSSSEESGRTQLVVWSTLYGLWLGVAVPNALGADDPEPFGVGILLGGPGGFLAGRAYAAAFHPDEGHARTLTLGGFWGTWQGLGWQQVLDVGIGGEESCTRLPDGRLQCDTFGESTSEETFAAMVVGGLTGIGTAALVARSRPISPGTATAASLGGLWGTWYGFALGEIAGADDEPLWTWTLLGGNVGLAAGALIGSRAGVSRSRSRLVSIAGVAGMVAGWGLDLVFDVNGTPDVLYLPTVGSAAGLLAGAALFDEGRDDVATPGERPGMAMRVGGARLRPSAIRVETDRGSRVVPGVHLTLPAPRF